MNPADPPPNDNQPDEPWNSPGGKTLGNAVAFVVIVLAIFVWTDSAAFGTSREMRYASWFLQIALFFGGAFLLQRWLRRRGK